MSSAASPPAARPPQNPFMTKALVRPSDSLAPKNLEAFQFK